METNELLTLLLADRVRERAAELRTAAARAKYPTTEMQAKFKDEHPLSLYWQPALDELRAIAAALTL